MDKNPLISILSSVYNERLYIEQTIRSVLNQTYQHWEWIILDDGSNDGTADILRDIRDKRVKCVFQKNIGYLAKNMNEAMKMSCGNIIATLDGDDYWPPNKLDIQVRSFEDQEVVLSYGECFLINYKGKTIGHVGLPEDSRIANNNPTGSALKRLLVDIDCFICNTTVMYRKSSLLDVGGFVEENGLFPDFSTWVKLSFVGRFSAIPSCLGYYRKHLKSLTFNINQEYYFENQLNFLREFYRQNIQRLRDISVNIDMDTIERHWNHIKIKNKIIYRLILLSSFIGFDFVTLLICYINNKTYIKKFIKKILQI